MSSLQQIYDDNLVDALDTYDHFISHGQTRSVAIKLAAIRLATARVSHLLQWTPEHEIQATYSRHCDDIERQLAGVE